MKFADFCCIFPGRIRGASRSRLHMTVYTRAASSKNKNHKVATSVEDGAHDAKQFPGINAMQKGDLIYYI